MRAAGGGKNSDQTAASPGQEHARLAEIRAAMMAKQFGGGGGGIMSDSRQQRVNMVESQVRPSDVTDRRIIRAMLEIPREVFAPEAMRPLAYMDDDLQVGLPSPGKEARYLLAPRILAKLLQLADIGLKTMHSMSAVLPGTRPPCSAGLQSRRLLWSAMLRLRCGPASSCVSWAPLMPRWRKRLSAPERLPKVHMMSSSSMALCRKCHRSCSINSGTVDGWWLS